MSFARFWQYIQYSMVCPSDVTSQRWKAMVSQWANDGPKYIDTFMYFDHPSDEYPTSWNYELAKSARKRGQRRSFFNTGV